MNSLRWAGLALLLFIVLTAAIISGASRGLDTAIFDLIHSTTCGGLSSEIGRDITALGSNEVVALFVVAGFGFLALHGQHSSAWLLAACFAGCLALIALLKALVNRPRPQLAESAVQVFTSSFPSSHATMSATIAMTALLLLAEYETDRLTRLFATGLAVGVVLSVGVSRVYLGVHWPSDVAAGWLLGSGWALLCWAVRRRYVR